jgi:hypothetical protein
MFWRAEVTVMRCNRCDHEVPTENSFQHLGKTLCEDCYIDIKYPAKACDPWAVYSATRSRQALGLKETEGLTDLQKQICEFIRDKGKITWEELMRNFNLTESQLQSQLAVLRHRELIKGHKEADKIYLVPFDQNEG